MGKKILAWVKSNVIVVACVALAIIGISVMLFFSARWNAKIKKTLSEDVTKAMSALNNTNVNYELPTVIPTAEKWESKQRPNEAANKAVVEELKRIAGESQRIREIAEERNKKPGVLVDKLFPAPENESARVRLLTQLVKVFKESHESLLKAAGAGDAPDPEAIADQLDRLRQREERERTSSRVDQKLTDEEAAAIKERLSRQRLDAYVQAAGQLAFYADPSVFKSLPVWKEGDLPSLELAWEWQLMYWVHEDIIKALVKANTSESGLRLNLPQGVVKRVISITLAPSPFMARFDGSSGSSEASADPAAAAEAGVAPADPSAEVPKDLTRSFTGRPAINGLYDVREAELVVLADANRLPRLIHAINTTNFMTVIDLDIKAVDPFDDLKSGYVYGNDALVEARIVIETVWLRTWMKPWMPKTIRAALGIPEDPAPEPAPEEPADPNAENPGST